MVLYFYPSGLTCSGFDLWLVMMRQYYVHHVHVHALHDPSTAHGCCRCSLASITQQHTQCTADGSPSCTKQANAFKDSISSFKKAGAEGMLRKCLAPHPVLQGCPAVQVMPVMCSDWSQLRRCGQPCRVPQQAGPALPSTGGSGRPGMLAGS